MKSFLFVALLLFSGCAHTIQLDQQGCREYAIWSQDIVWARTVGAPKEKVLENVREHRRDTDQASLVLVLRHFEMLWSTGMPWHLVGGLAYRECIERRGKYEDVT